MFTVGQFSQFSRVSVKMLRHYDRIGLLPPAHVDPLTNYRYYAADQLPRLQRLLALKDLGFTLEQIRILLDEELSTDQLRGMMKLRRAEIQGQLREGEEQLARIEARLAALDEAQSFPYDVVIRAVEAETVATIRQRLTGGTTIADLFEELESTVARYQARAPRPPLLLYHDLNVAGEVQDVEVVVPIRQPFPADERVQTRLLAAHEQVACVIHAGGYGALSQALRTLRAWVEQHAYVGVAPLRAAYLRFGADQDGYRLPDAYLATTPSEFVTELQLPVARR